MVVVDLPFVLAQGFVSQLSFITYFHYSFILVPQKFGMMKTTVDSDDKHNEMSVLWLW